MATDLWTILAAPQAEGIASANICLLAYLCFIISNIRHEDFRLCVTLRVHPLDSETGWTGELWSNTVLLILEN